MSGPSDDSIAYLTVSSMLVISSENARAMEAIPPPSPLLAMPALLFAYHESEPATFGAAQSIIAN